MAASGKLRGRSDEEQPRKAISVRQTRLSSAITPDIRSWRPTLKLSTNRSPNCSSCTFEQVIYQHKLGCINFEVLAQLTLAQVKIITRARSNLVQAFDDALITTANVHDSPVWIGVDEGRQFVLL